MSEYSRTLEWMFQQLPMYQRVGQVAFKKDLSNALAFSSHLQHPESSFPAIHVGGTNGKGSVSHMLASILQEAGYKVGLYTSPHLKDFRERIKINGQEIPEKNVIEFISTHKSFLETRELSFFEMTVGMAFDFFRDEKVDIAIIEVGLGGRLDSTNIITPLLSVITNIGLDHTAILGNTLSEIAWEKAGIIKPKVPVIIGEKQAETTDVFLEAAKSNSSEITFASENLKNDEFTSDLKGSYQKKNINTVLTAVKKLSSNWHISEENIQKGLLNVQKNTGLRGRWEILRNHPKVICDTAHNAEGLKYVTEQLAAENCKQLHFVIGVVNDKDLNKILKLFPKSATYYFCKPNIPRGLDAKVLQTEAEKYGLIGENFISVKKAYEKAIQNADKNDVIYIGGSTFTVAEII